MRRSSSLRLQDGFFDAGEEFAEGDFPASAAIGQNGPGVEAEQRRRHVRAGGGVHDVSRHRGSVSHLVRSQVSGADREQGIVLLDGFIRQDLIDRDRGADGEALVGLRNEIASAGNSLEIDDQFRLYDARSDIGEEVCPAGEQFCVLTFFVERFEEFVQGRRRLVMKFLYHRFSFLADEAVTGCLPREAGSFIKIPIACEVKFILRVRRG